MKKYFYLEGNQQIGPLTIDELRLRGVHQNTMIWFDGLPNWQPAGNIPELQSLFTVPPQVTQQQYQQPAQQPYAQPPVAQYPPQPIYQEKEDRLGIFASIFSFIIPLVGLIIYLKNKKAKPQKAKRAGILALVGFIVGMILNALMTQ